MNTDKDDLSLDGFLEQLRAPTDSDASRRPTTNLNIWVPASYAKKFQMIQAKSRRKFSRVLRKMVMDAIDKVKIDEAG